jgi:hypothetical protein
MRGVLIGAMALFLLVAAACGGTGGPVESVPASTPNPTNGDSQPTDGSQPTAANPSGSAGTLTLGEQVIELTRARCFLEEQDAAAGGGKILFTAQGFGALPDGTELVLDVSRYDEQSQFTGDAVDVGVGDPRGANFYSWEVIAELGTVEQVGSTLRADGLTLRHSEDDSEIEGAFDVNCGA